LYAAPYDRMEGMKMEPLIAVPPDASDREVFEIFDKYNLHSLAVVDGNGRPIGAIEVDDVVTRLRNR
jgi:Mg/Co/Ni transporter MgtE